MSTIIESIERSQLRSGIPAFQPGDRVKVHFQVVEGSRRRTQVFEGVVLKRQGSGARETFTVRKQSFGVGVERTFPLHSPKIERLEIAGRGDVRRAKLYYLRGRVGKAARVAERRWGIDEQIIAAPAAAEGEALDSEGLAQSEAEVADVPEAEEGEEPAGEQPAVEEAEAAAEDAEPEAGEGAEAQDEAAEDAESGEGEQPAVEEAEAEPEAEEPQEPAKDRGNAGEGDD